MEISRHHASEQAARLDSYLVKHFPQHSRNYWQTKISAGEVLLNGKLTKSAQPIHTNDEICFVEVAKIITQDAQLKDDTLVLPIIYEDDSVIVVDKPAGLVVYQPAGKIGPSVQTMIAGKLTYQGERAGIIHRLDRDTSGVLMIAKNKMAEDYLKNQFAKRLVEKVYDVLVWGHLELPTARVELPIAHSGHNYQKMKIAAQGKLGVMEYKVKKSYANYDLLTVRLYTGRTHQIRVQLNHLGHPVVGDKLYGRRSAPIRQFVHAQSLALTMLNGEKKHFQAPLASDLANYLTTLSS